MIHQAMEGLRADIENGYTLTPPDMTLVGEQELTVAYEGVTATFTITITEQPILPFTDVGNNAWYYKDVVFVYGKGLMHGTSDKTFEPKLTTTRAMICAILYRMENATPPIAGTNKFKDVPEDAWYHDAVAWASFNGITVGYGNGKFGPNDPITREQMATMLHRYASYKGLDISARGKLTDFKDFTKISVWATAATSWAYSEGLLSGYPSGDDMVIAPKDDAERSQIAAMIHRFCNWVLDTTVEQVPAPVETPATPSAKP